MLPEGWKITTLGKACEGNLQTGPFGSQLHAYEYQETGISVMMPKDIRNCRANISKAAKISPQRADDLSKHKLFSGDLLFSRRGDVTRFALIDQETEGNLCGTGCLRARPSKNHSPVFLSYILQKNTVKMWLEQNAVGQTMPNMNTAILNELPLISASSREEEDKIARILSTWDRAIEKLQALIAAKQKRKKALMQQLLTGSMRIPVFEGEWKEVRLKELLHEIKRNKVENPENLELLTVRLHCKGVVRSKKYPATTNQGRPYFIRKEGELIIGRQNLHNGGIGIVPMEVSGCIASNAISSFEIKNGTSKNFILYRMSMPSFLTKVDNLIGGTGQKEISVNELLKIKINAPLFYEQQKIATILSAADQQITLHQNQLTALKQQKTGLMQQLLTGKKRVKVNQVAA